MISDHGTRSADDMRSSVHRLCTARASLCRCPDRGAPGRMWPARRNCAVRLEELAVCRGRWAEVPPRAADTATDAMSSDGGERGCARTSSMHSGPRRLESAGRRTAIGTDGQSGEHGRRSTAGGAAVLRALLEEDGGRRRWRLSRLTAANAKGHGHF